ncbi:MAG: HRDC domain-containing protein, partial [Verrucomicrobiota bacterium]
SVYVEYHEAVAKSEADDRPKRIDYRDILDGETFALFARIREWRKVLAAEEKVPAYAILTNEQMAEVAKSRPSSLGSLKAIKGFGEGRAAKYGESLLSCLANGFEDKGEADKA